MQKQEGLLKRIKNIEGKTDNQLRTIEGQKTKQSDPIGKIKYCDEKLKKLAEDVIKKIKKYENKDLKYTIYTIEKGDKYNVNLYKNLEGFVRKIMKGELSRKEVKEQQDKLWDEIYKMKKKIREKKG